MKDPNHLILLHDKVRELEKRVSLLEKRVDNKVDSGYIFGTLATDEDIKKLEKANKDFCGSQ